MFLQLLIHLQEYLGFIQAIGDTIAGKKISNGASTDQSKAISGLMDMLDKLSSWADQIEPEDMQQRFGNKAFRRWYARLEEVIN